MDTGFKQACGHFKESYDFHFSVSFKTIKVKLFLTLLLG